MKNNKEKSAGRSGAECHTERDKEEKLLQELQRVHPMVPGIGHHVRHGRCVEELGSLPTVGKRTHRRHWGPGPLLFASGDRFFFFLKKGCSFSASF